MRVILGEFARFVGVGAFMTIAGYALILAFAAFAGMSPFAANLAAYAVLLAVSYWLHARITFRAGTSARGLLGYLGAFAVAYLANMLVLFALVGRVHDAVAQLLAVATYAVVQFALGRAIAFAPRKG